ncbi:hypothetical protein E2C01_101569 [Portunus trituberculatus]|uniref:Uncharacterized protein n=1 Tax=Portunus trituberculatus TaxID=210409 RepID=A0A5B7K9Y1_PORTR|nr:hypothetical protein [Portunus trituberculatus]
MTLAVPRKSAALSEFGVCHKYPHHYGRGAMILKRTSPTEKRLPSDPYPYGSTVPPFNHLQGH